MLDLSVRIHTDNSIQMPYLSVWPILTITLTTEDWCFANVVPVFKKGDKKEALNYRPISLTCICKMLESVVRDHIMAHFVNNQLFSTQQFGFLKGRNTVLQLLKMLDLWTESLEEG